MDSFKTDGVVSTTSTLSSEVKEVLILFTVKKIPIKNMMKNNIMILYKRFIDMTLC